MIFIIFCLMAIYCNAQDVITENEYPNKITAKAGNETEVEVKLLLTDDFKTVVPIDNVKQFVQRILLVSSYKCKYPRTFVPNTFFGITILDTLEISYNDTIIEIVKYKCFVQGYAKNAYGVEDNVNIVIGAIPDNDRFLIKNCSMSYEITDSSFRSANSKGIDFEYGGKHYFIDTFGRDIEVFLERLSEQFVN